MTALCHLRRHAPRILASGACYTCRCIDESDAYSAELARLRRDAARELMADVRERFAPTLGEGFGAIEGEGATR